MSGYVDWLAVNAPTDALAGRGRCHALSTAMVAAFPELRLVGGYYHCPIWGAQQHWWCESPAGDVLDPTASQFPSLGIGEYEELAPDSRPVGRCMDCGEDVFGIVAGIENREAPTFCSRECAESTIAYLNAPRPPL